MRVSSVTVQGPSRELECYVADPTEPGVARAAVVVIHEIFGPDAHIQDVTRRFAQLGYVAAAPNLFTGELQQLLTRENIAFAMQAFAQAPPGLRRDPQKLAEFAASQPPERRPILEAFGRISQPQVQSGFAQDLVAVRRHLIESGGVDSSRVASVGFCFGGAISARFATVDPALRAAVIFYGQNPPFSDVPKIEARMLGLYGGADPGITETVPEFAQAMDRAGKSFEYHVYPGAKHAFFNDTRPNNYDQASAEDAWIRVQNFLRASLETPRP